MTFNEAFHRARQDVHTAQVKEGRSKWTKADYERLANGIEAQMKPKLCSYCSGSGTAGLTTFKHEPCPMCGGSGRNA